MDSYRFHLLARTYHSFRWMMVTVDLVFMVEVAYLDPLQMVLVGTVLEVPTFLFEIPTGVLADVVSLEVSVIIGHAMIGAGFLAMALWPTFGLILLSQVIWGVGHTLTSDAYYAWLSSEVGVERANDAFPAGHHRIHLQKRLTRGREQEPPLSYAR